MLDFPICCSYASPEYLPPSDSTLRARLRRRPTENPPPSRGGEFLTYQPNTFTPQKILPEKCQNRAFCIDLYSAIINTPMDFFYKLQGFKEFA